VSVDAEQGSDPLDGTKREELIDLALDPKALGRAQRRLIWCFPFYPSDIPIAPSAGLSRTARAGPTAHRNPDTLVTPAIRREAFSLGHRR